MTSQHDKTSVAAISIFASGGMAAAKFVVGIAIGSLALISEALHSSIDLVATIITWAVVRVSDRPADDERHYGHGKLESISALGVTALLFPLLYTGRRISRREATLLLVVYLIYLVLIIRNPAA